MKPGRKPFSFPDISVLCAEYESGQSTTALGKKYGCAQDTVRRALDRAGIKRRPRGRRCGTLNKSPYAVGANEIFRMRDEGKTVQQIAASIGCTRQNVSQVLVRWQGRAP